MSGFWKVISDLLLVFAVSELRVFKKITLQQKAAFNNTLEHCVMPRKSFAAESQYCNPCFSWDISHGPSGWFFSHEIQLDHRLLWYVELQAKNIHYFWNMIITVQNRLFFHDLIRFYHISNKLILSLLWHLYSLMLFWCVLYIYLIHSSVHTCITICDLYTACLACAVTGKSFSLLWWGSLGQICQGHCQTSLWTVPVCLPSSPNETAAPPRQEKTRTICCFSYVHVRGAWAL